MQRRTIIHTGHLLIGEVETGALHIATRDDECCTDIRKGEITVRCSCERIQDMRYRA
jgi:hypothetical protein